MDRLETPASESTRDAAPREEAQRLARERDYHNHRFADDSERESRVGRFYSAIEYGFELYRQRVSEESAGRWLLEYGCGNGALAFDVADQARQVVGIDISDVAIEQARHIAALRGLQNVTFVVDNAEAMHLADRYVDVVAGSGIVHHLDIPKSMREVRRVLRNGGTAIFAEPLGHNPLLNWYRRRTPELRTVDEHPLLERDLRSMAGEFTSMKVTYFGLIAPVLGLFARETSPTNPATRFVWWLDRLVCRVPLLSRYAWYCVVELRA
jgi:ubiquinone/menaquinone biosynthesis C-methylase UbiE